MSKYCYNEACTKDFLNLENDVIFAKQAGFDLIELRFDYINKYLEKHTINDLKTLLNNSKIEPSALNALYIYPEFLTDKKDPQRDDEIFCQLDLIKNLYKEAGINQCIVVAPLMNDESSCEIYKKPQITESCVRILKYLSSSMPHIKWIFEPVGLSRSLVRDAEHANEIISAVNRSNVGLVLDSYNLYLKERKDNYSFSNIPSDKIFAIHMMNGKKVPADEKIIDQRYRTFCEDGDAIDLFKFLNALKEINYKGMISTEVFNPDYQKLQSHKEIVFKSFNELQNIVSKFEKYVHYSFFNN